MKKVLASLVCSLCFILPLSAQTKTSIQMNNTTYSATYTTKTIAPGVEYYDYIIDRSSSTYTDGSRIHVLKVDLNNPNVLIKHGDDGRDSRRTLATQAERMSTADAKVVAGVNANFWITSETPYNAKLQYEPFGASIKDGHIYSDPNCGTIAHVKGPASTTGLFVIDDKGKCYIDYLKPQVGGKANSAGSGWNFTLTNHDDGETIGIDQVNGVVCPSYAAMYTSIYGSSKSFRSVQSTSNYSTYSGSDHVEVLLDFAPGVTDWNTGAETKMVIKAIRKNTNGKGTLGSYDCAIVCRDWYATEAANWKVGQNVTITSKVNFANIDSPSRVLQATSGNCICLKNGVVGYNSSQNNYNGKNYPRTIYATDDTGRTLWLIVCEHYPNRKYKYQGFTTTAMAQFAKWLGATWATQVDCGGSAQMYAGGQQVSTSMDSGGVRAVQSGLFVLTTNGSSSGGGTTTPDPDPETPSTNYITATTVGSTDLSGTTTDTNPAYFDIKVSTTGTLTSDINYNPTSGSVTVAALTGWDALTGGTLRVTLKPDFKSGAGTYDGIVAIQSGTHRREVPFAVHLTEGTGDSGSTTPTPTPTPDTSTGNYIVPGTLGETDLIYVNATSFVLTGAHGATDAPYVDVKVTGVNLGDPIAINSGSGSVKWSTLSDWDDMTGGTLRLTLNTTFDVGTYNSEWCYIAIQSTADHKIKLPFTANITDGETVIPTPDPLPVVDDFIVPGTLGDNYLSANAESFTLTGVVGSSEVSYVDVVITGNSLPHSISVNSVSSTVIVTKLDGWDDMTGGTLRMTLNTNFTYGAGTYTGTDYYVAVKATDEYLFRIPFTAILKEGEGTTTPEPEPEPEPTPDVDITITGLTEGWIYSTNKGNLAEATYFSSAEPQTRDMCYADGKLYVLNAAKEQASVSIVDAATGKATGKSLSVAGIEGGTYMLSGIKSLGNTVIGANFCGTTGELKIYKWANDDATPELWFSTTDHGNKEVGRSFNTYGDMTNGKIAFGDNTGIVYFTVKDGVINTTPTTVNITTVELDGNASNQSITVLEDGSFWLNNKGTWPIHFNADGSVKTTLSPAVGKKHGAAITEFTYGKHNYVAYTTTLGTTASVWGNGALQLMDVTNESAPVLVGNTSYPAAGLGEAAWGGVGANAVDYAITSDNSLNLWVMVPLQGIAMYKFVNIVSGIDDVEFDTDAPVQYYNLQGVEINAETLAPGIYIRRQGNTVSKVLVK